MRWWHEWRANHWAWRYIRATGKVVMHRESLGAVDQWDMRDVQAELLMSEGKVIYHRLRAGQFA